VEASTLSALLQEHRIPAMVLNACQSAMLDERAADPFASVAASLLKAGTRSVVAMSYALYVSGAREFLPAFYTRLFETGSIADAARVGRQKMLEKRGRICARGRYDLHDWIVPVVYQQDALELRFDRKGEAAGPPSKKLPEEALDGRNPYGLIGRDGPILDLERAMRRPVPGILIHGLGGVGKTTLARGFVEWLAATGGLGAGCIWLSFQEVRSAEAVINRMGEQLFGPNFAAAGADEKLDALVGALKQTSMLVVWDNFEAVAGLPPAVPATMAESDRRRLRLLLERLRGGKTKVLITSRSEEEWLGPEQRRKVPLGGLDGEDRWAYAEAMLRDLGVPVRRDDAKLVELMDLLGGHPLAMRVVLPRLERRTAGDLVEALRSNVAALGDGGEEAETKLYATLKLAEDALPEDLKVLLLPLGMHERYVEGDYLERMAKQVDGAWTRERIDRFLGLQVNAGLLRDEGQSVYEMHPALSGFLRSNVVQSASGEACDVWSRAFVGVMGRVADAHTPRQLHQKRAWFHCHGANSYHGLAEAERLGMSAEQAALLQGLGAYALQVRGFDEARALYERLAEAWKAAGYAIGEAGAYHQLGRVAEEQRDFSAAEAWYRKSLAIKEKQGNEHGAAQTYHQLGIVAQEQRDFSAAEAWYRKAMAIFETQGNEHGAAQTYHQLGIVAQEQRDFSAAEAWYRKAMAIFETQGNEHDAARTYHQLGIVAQAQRNFPAAEAWYQKSLAIKEKQGDEHGVAITYGQLGIVAQEQQDFSAAEAWYRKAMAIFETQGNEHDAAITYGQLGITAALQEHFEDAGRWLVKSIATFARSRDPEGAKRNARNFLRFYQRAPAAEQAKLKAIWQDAGLGELPEIPTPTEST
jgi:tetratricopeptide (TPR) repeat protein